MRARIIIAAAGAACIAGTLAGCTFFAKIPSKQYFVMNYVVSSMKTRLNPVAYPFTIRLRDFNIEEAYNRPQIVYRQSPFELQYYYYRVWAVKPTRMIADLVYKHLSSSGIVTSVIRRLDEGPHPDYELSGNVEALEEYDSQELWFAHVAIRITLNRASDGTTIYSRRFDLRKRVYMHTPENVIKELSSLMEYIMTQTVLDLDLVFAKEYGIPVPASNNAPADADSAGFEPEPAGFDKGAP
ncbi:MAG: ABC-type transport auxiliary lipoprotein family protein [Chitinispirillaceae bacterium]|jgi:ABC-type uncharacterized transport system auxiliary subunit|nr:ABC-type transport auxiliary lipoprotein family protein [Chitinispirillaceae bacterium]